MNTEWINTAQIKREGSVGYIFISGVIEPNNIRYLCEKYTAISDIITALEKFDQDPTLETIALVINSNGGSVSGLTNLNNKIKAIQKPVISYVNDNCLSAAYWIASSTSKIVATSKAAFFGSIGVLTMAEKTDKFISIANTESPYKDVDPNTEEGKKEIQKQLDEIFNVFAETVAKNRNKSVEYVKENFGQGAAILAVSALAVGLIDEINESEETLPASLAVLAHGREIRHLASRNNTPSNSALDNKTHGTQSSTASVRPKEIPLGTRLGKNNHVFKESKKMEENEDKALTAEYVKELLTAVVTPLIEELQGLKDELASVKASAQTLEDDEDMDKQDEDENEDEDEDEYPNGNENEPNKHDASIAARGNRFGRRAFKDLSKRNAESRFRPYDDTNNTGKYEGLVREAFAKKGINMKARG